MSEVMRDTFGTDEAKQNVVIRNHYRCDACGDEMNVCEFEVEWWFNGRDVPYPQRIDASNVMHHACSFDCLTSVCSGKKVGRVEAFSDEAKLSLATALSGKDKRRGQ